MAPAVAENNQQDDDTTMKITPSARYLAVAAAFLLGGCATLEKQFQQPELSLSDAKITSISLSDMQVAFDVDVKNPNPMGLSMKGMSYTLQIQEKPLFNGALNERIKIEGNGTSRVQLPFTLRYEDIFGTLVALRDNKELRYTVSGDADFGLISLPYKKSGTFALPHLPDISVDNIRIKSLGLGGVDLAVDLRVANTNSFPIRLDGLDYDLKLANSNLLKGSAASPLSVGPNKQGKMQLNMSLNYTQLGNLLQTLRNASSLPVELNSEMKLPALRGSTSVPYSWKGDVPLMR